MTLFEIIVTYFGGLYEKNYSILFFQNALSERCCMTVNGLSHITLISSDLNRLEEILISVLDARKVYDSGAEQFSLSEERFYLIGNQNSVDETENLWLVAMKGNPKLERDYHHIAFAIHEDEIIKKELLIDGMKLEKKPPRPRVEGEGYSVYFYDFDSHLFELHSGTLAMCLKRYAKGK